jgi:hypothetical protein
MTIDLYADRYKRLLDWMNGYDISFSAIAEQLGISAPGARFVCRGKTCPTAHHQKLLALGFPAELLPHPLDKPRGRQRKIPKFPTLAVGQQTGLPSEC